jgi:hypothetical protein
MDASATERPRSKSVFMPLCGRRRRDAYRRALKRDTTRVPDCVLFALELRHAGERGGIGVIDPAAGFRRDRER